MTIDNIINQMKETQCLNCYCDSATFDDTEVGAVTATASGGFCLVANIKKDSNRNATSHIAVISILVLLRGIFALPIIFFLFTNKLDALLD